MYIPNWTKKGKKRKLRVFLSYAREDKDSAEFLYRRLKRDNFDPWMDTEEILPGYKWTSEIENAMYASDVILLCFSKVAIKKEGYIQKEKKLAKDLQDEKPDNALFIIPIRLDECDIPKEYKDKQWADFPKDYEKILKSLKQKEKNLKLKPPQSEQKNISGKNEANIRKGLNFLSIKDNPFGAEQAEDDIILSNVSYVLNRFYTRLPSFQRIRSVQAKTSILVYGPFGSGKTAIARYLMEIQDGYVSKTQCFSIYSLSKYRCSIRNIVKIIAISLLEYFLKNPQKFIGLNYAKRRSIANLWMMFVNREKLLARITKSLKPFHRGDEAKFIARINTLTNYDRSMFLSSEDDYINLLKKCIPPEHKSILILLDWQKKNIITKEMAKLKVTLQKLAKARIFLTVFMEAKPLYSGVDLSFMKYEELKWETTNLQEFLKMRLNQIGDDSIASWCDEEARRQVPFDGQTLDEWFVEYSDGTPRGLIHKGNQALALIGQNQRLLSTKDLESLYNF